MSHVPAAKARPSVVSAIIWMANPIFVAVAVLLPVGGLVLALAAGSAFALNYVHIMTGAMWTGIDLFMGFVLGPVLGGMDPAGRAGVFKRLVPKMTFLMPVLAAVTTTAGFELAQALGYPLSAPKIVAAIAITGILAIQGFGFLLPNEIRVFRQLLSPKPDIDLISRLGMRTARLGGVQGVLQVAIILVMAVIRF